MDPRFSSVASKLECFPLHWKFGIVLQRSFPGNDRLSHHLRAQEWICRDEVFSLDPKLNFRPIASLVPTFWGKTWNPEERLKVDGVQSVQQLSYNNARTSYKLCSESPLMSDDEIDDVGHAAYHRLRLVIKGNSSSQVDQPLSGPKEPRNKGTAGVCGVAPLITSTKDGVGQQSTHFSANT
ncbi:uncharacterized protein PADG_08720 [Paracoccidioides brasiliensis Pb18]|uniref:Uncharacterized protein n=1 Tax=Paracoccidioides brasiliensis (strain Pb18) TaxID=502780 RepID=C1GN82_PARBD|nr:uncharacterized protein PADG_08720 [Paracoccidioides brasiliensis Pb18]EEH46284.2 hypothetical protein PADG_08720 [Paracoccidioides brasiliensis Pb18]